MGCSVSKNSNSTASLRAKQLQLNFQRFCQMELTKKFIVRKLPKLIKMQKKVVVYDAKVGWHHKKNMFIMEASCFSSETSSPFSLSSIFF